MRTVPPRPTEQGQKLLALLRRWSCWKKSGWAMNKPVRLRCAFTGGQRRQSGDVVASGTGSVLADSPIRLNLQVEDETRTRNVCVAAKWSAQ